MEELSKVNGAKCWDSYQNQEFCLHASIQLHIMDYPGQNKVLQNQGKHVRLYVVQMWIYTSVHLCVCMSN